MLAGGDVVLWLVCPGTSPGSGASARLSHLLCLSKARRDWWAQSFEVPQNKLSLCRLGKLRHRDVVESEASEVFLPVWLDRHLSGVWRE